MIKEEIKFRDSVIFEGMTSIRALISAIRDHVSDRKILTIYFDPDKIKKISKEVGYLKAVSKELGYSVQPLDHDTMEQRTIGSTHGGIIAECSDRHIPPLHDSLPVLSSNGFYAMIDGIEDPYNFGYALRSLYACGCDGVILPGRSWMSAAGVVARSSAGSSELLPMYGVEASADAARLFHDLGYTVVCATEKTDLVLGGCELTRPILLVVGGEKRGISKPLMEACDLMVKIPYARDFHASLSAASATTMFAFEILRQNQKNADR